MGVVLFYGTFGIFIGYIIFLVYEILPDEMILKMILKFFIYVIIPGSLSLSVLFREQDIAMLQNLPVILGVLLGAEAKNMYAKIRRTRHKNKTPKKS